MTCREKLKLEHPECVDEECLGGSRGCPHDYGYLPDPDCENVKCDACWDREIPEEKAKWKINPDGWYPYCSNCGHEPKNGVISKYCPNCGKEMENSLPNKKKELDTDIIETIRALINLSIKDLSALPSAYITDTVIRRLENIDGLLTVGCKK